MTLIENVRKRSQQPEARMPRGTLAPVEDYDEDVMRAAQKHKAAQTMIATLQEERDDWRRKALDGDAEVKRLETQLARDSEAHAAELTKLTAERDRKIEELEQQRDDFKLKLTRYETKVTVQGKAVLDLASSLSTMVRETLEEIKAERNEPDAAGAGALAAVRDAIEKAVEPMPNVVLAGPRRDAD